MRRALVPLLLAGACTAGGPSAPEAPHPTDAIWGQSITPGVLVVAVPGTGAYDTLGRWIDETDGVLDLATNSKLNPIVLEQAIAATQRAGVSFDDVTLAVWGAGATKNDHFMYRSLDGTVVSFAVLGGTNSCAVGSISDNLLNYTRDHADVDARDLWARASKLAAPSVTIVSHSYGGAIAEHLVLDQLADDSLAFVFAAGVPKMILGESMMGPGMRPFGATSLYEVDRPDDPVHALDFAWDLEGHQYDIVLGDTFMGSYGITTTELSCHGQPGACPTN